MHSFSPNTRDLVQSMPEAYQGVVVMIWLISELQFSTSSNTLGGANSANQYEMISIYDSQALNYVDCRSIWLAQSDLVAWFRKQKMSFVKNSDRI